MGLLGIEGLRPVDVIGGGRFVNPKAEIRRSKEGRNPKAEITRLLGATGGELLAGPRPRCLYARGRGGKRSVHDLLETRPLGFFRVSAFGFRISASTRASAGN